MSGEASDKGRGNMGKFLETLKQAAPRQVREEDEVRPDAPPDAAEAEDAPSDEEIPFIEVGPHKSMDASASVLAVRPAPKAIALRPAQTVNGPRLPHFAPEIIAHHQPDHPVSGQYRELLAAMTPPAAGQGAPALLLAPALLGGDAVVVLLNVAVTAARQGGRRVVVVDADTRQPAVAERLGLPTRPGLSDVLAGAVTLEQALQPTGQANLTVLTAGAPAPAGPRLVVETPASVLRQLRRHCDLVMVLGPTWDGRPEAAALAAACDVVYLVLPEREAGSPRLDELLQTIPRHGARLGGCILAA